MINFKEFDLQPLDIVLVSKKKNWLSKLICKCSTSPEDKTKTEYSHVSTIEDCDYTLIEALGCGVKRTKIFKYAKKYKVLIARRIDLDAAGQSLIMNKVRSYIGEDYGFLKIVTHYFDYHISKILNKTVICFRRLTKNNNYPTCSWLVAFAFFVKGVLFNNIKPEFCQPDDIADDILIVNKDKYKIIIKQ